MLQGIRVVFLDIDNTLLDFDACSRISMEKSFAECGLPFESTMYGTFQQVNNGLWRRIEQGTLTRSELHATRWSLVLQELGLTGDGPAVETQFLQHLATEAIPVEGSYELLPYLYSKYTVCIASNAPYDQQVKRLTTVDMLRYFHKAFISERLGAAKPSRSYFDACFAQLPNITPEQCIIIGDSLTADIGGGKAYGLHTCWYDHHKTGAKSYEADYTVTGLLEIKKIL